MSLAAREQIGMYVPHLHMAASPGGTSRGAEMADSICGIAGCLPLAGEASAREGGKDLWLACIPPSSPQAAPSRGRQAQGGDGK